MNKEVLRQLRKKYSGHPPKCPTTKLGQILFQKRMTYRNLADQVGVTRQMIAHLAHNFRRPSLTTAQRISEVLGVSVEELFPLSKSKNEEPSRGGDRG
jgi:transcriptional regulator with XRE-family HTH domain